MSVTAGTVALLERERELEALHTAAAQGGVVLVTGEAGSGKSELLRRFCEDSAARVLWGACDALFTPRPLGPLLDIADDVGGELQEQVAAAAAPHDVARAALRELERGPSVLVLEDLHWADEATLDVVRLIARRLDGLPALLIISFRDEQVGRSHPLRVVLGDLPRTTRVSRVDVPPLSREAVAALAEPAQLDLDALYARTGGNPFFVTEVVAAGAHRIPETVRDAVLARAARLAPINRTVLDALSVVPQRAELWLLEAMVDDTAGLEDCLTSGILRADADGVEFRHELARLTVEESLPPDRRAALHRRALPALAERDADLARLAHHAEGAGDADAVLRHAGEAAERASAVGAHREAAGQYERALRFAGGLHPEARAELLSRFAKEGYLTDMRGECIDALEQVEVIHRGTGDVDKLADALFLRAAALGCRGCAAESAAAAEEAIALLADGSEAQRARAYAERSGMAMMAGRLGQAIKAGKAAIELATRINDHGMLVRALNNVGTSRLMLGDDAGRLELLQSLALAREADDAPAAGRAYINLLAAMGHRREWAPAEPYLEEGIEFTREHGLEAWEHCLLGGRAMTDLAAGRFDEAAATAGEVLTRAWDDHASARLEPLCVLGLVRARRGDPQAWEPLDEALEAAEADGSPQFLRAVVPARAEAAWLEGRAEAVDRETAATLALAVELRDGWLAAELLTWRRRAGCPDIGDDGTHLDGPGALTLAGDHRAAAEAWEALEHPYEAALARSDADDEDMLREAHEALQALGAKPAAAIVARRLRARGARNLRRGPQARTRDNPAGLTGRELEVLELLAEGLRNVDISRRLLLSEKTVDHHVSAILRKLGVRSRGHAATEALRLGLLAG